MSLEVLTGVCGKLALFQVGSCHVAQSLHVPAILFQVLLQLGHNKVPASSNFQLLVNYQHCKMVASETSCTLDQKFTACKYATYCRLLFHVLKHHKDECELCIALLDDSFLVLHHCLESEKDSVQGK